MKKQTAVQWLTEKIFNLYGVGYGDIEIWNQAQDMESEQIKESYKAGFNLRDSFNWECDAPWDTKEDLKHNEQEFDKYYNSIYKGGEQ